MGGPRGVGNTCLLLQLATALITSVELELNCCCRCRLFCCSTPVSALRLCSVAVVLLLAVLLAWFCGFVCCCFCWEPLAGVGEGGGDVPERTRRTNPTPSPTCCLAKASLEEPFLPALLLPIHPLFPLLVLSRMAVEDYVHSLLSKVVVALIKRILYNPLAALAHK